MSHKLRALQDALSGSGNPPSPGDAAAAPAPSLAPPERMVTERIAPRRISEPEVQVAERPIGEASSLAEAVPAEESVAEVERLLALLCPSVIECWTSSGDATIVAPAVGAEVLTARASEIIDATAPSEVELEFRPIQPRRAAAVNVPPQALAQREAIELQEQQVRQAVRGPRPESVVRPCAWETTVLADLEDARLAARFGELTERWLQEREVSGSGRLLLSSLALPLAACEVALRAATLLARREHTSVLLIDGDPDGALSRRLAIIGKAGLTELLASLDAHGETIYPTATPRLHVLPRGRGVWPATTDALRVNQLLAELSHEYEWLIVLGGDPASAPVTTFARLCEATYVVAPLGETQVDAARQHLAALQTAGARILGAIATE